MNTRRASGFHPLLALAGASGHTMGMRTRLGFHGRRAFRLVAVLLSGSKTTPPHPGSSGPPLRVFIRASPKTHGPGEHDYPRFLAEWTKLLNERGAVADGALTFPTEEQLAKTDVLLVYEIGRAS